MCYYSVNISFIIVFKLYWYLICCWIKNIFLEASDMLCISEFMDYVIYADNRHTEVCWYCCSEWRHCVVARRLTPLLRRIGCVVSWTTAGAETTRVYRASVPVAGSRACNPPLPHYSTPDRGAEYCDDRVCVSPCVCVFVCPRAYLWKYTSDLCQFFARVTYGRGSVLLRRRCNTLCSSGFMDDVILAHKPRQLNVTAQLMEAQPTCSLGLGYKWRVEIPVAGQWTHTHEPTFRAPRSGPTRPQWACWVFMTSCLQIMSLRIAKMTCV